MFDDLKRFAKENKVPIIQDEGLQFLLSLIKENQVESILEIGTAIGYSALQFATIGVKVDTIERDIEMVSRACENLRQYDHENRVTLFAADASLIDISQLGMYDLIFIDGAKSKYQLFFNRFAPLLKPKGLIVCDNLDFHHLDKSMVSRGTRQLLTKIEKFKDFLEENQDFITTVYHIGDGISVSKRKVDV